MAWVTWRQHRLALAGVAALFGVAAVYLLITGVQMHHAYAAVAACRPAGSGICRQVAGNFLNTYAPGVGPALGLLQVIPALIGAFAGAPVLARELETGTFRYTWTQGFGRARWTVAKLVPLAVAVTVAAGAFSVLVSWYIQPIFGAGDDNGPLYPTIFDLRGVALAAWTLAAFAIGGLAGMLIRRVVPAIAVTLAVYVGLAFAVGAFLRDHYLAPLVTTSSLNLPGSAWILSQWWTKGGATLSPAAMYQVMDNAMTALNPTINSPGQKASAYSTMLQYLTQHGYTYWTQYQPGSRFWPFQWIESGGLLALSVLFIAAAVWLVRRRAA
jgi:ABC-type transport system involved in multi-copper enzyme maturation permease subunit